MSDTEVIVPDKRRLALSDGRFWNEELVVREILGHTEAIIVSAYEIGRRLLWAKEEVGHGRFEDWCADTLPFNLRTAQRYMQVAEFLVDNPKLLKPAAKAGLKKTLLLTTLAPDQLEELMSGGLVGEASIEDLDKVPYAKLQRDVRALRHTTERTEAELAARESELSKTKEAVAELSGALDVDAEDRLKKIRKVREGLCTAILLAHAQLRPLVDRMRLGELSPLEAAELVGVLEFSEVLVKNTVYQARASIGEGYWQDAVIENLERPRCAEDNNRIPAALLPDRPLRVVKD